MTFIAYCLKHEWLTENLFVGDGAAMMVMAKRGGKKKSVKCFSCHF